MASLFQVLITWLGAIDFAGLIAGLLAAIAALLAGGCAPNAEPIERANHQMMLNVVKPAIEKTSADLASRTGQLQGQGSLINPGYRIEGYGVFGTGVVYQFTLRTDGVSANLAGAAQFDNDAQPKPTTRSAAD